MNTIDIILVLSLVFVLITVISLFILGRNEKYKKLTIFKYLPLLAVILLFFNVFYIHHFYKNQLAEQALKLEENTKEISTLKNNQTNDTNLLDLKVKLDTLEKQNKELTQILEEVDKGERITGQKTKVRQNIENRLESNRETIQKVRRSINVQDSVH